MATFQVLLLKPMLTEAMTMTTTVFQMTVLVQLELEELAWNPLELMLEVVLIHSY